MKIRHPGRAKPYRKWATNPATKPAPPAPSMPSTLIGNTVVFGADQAITARIMGLGGRTETFGRVRLLWVIFEISNSLKTSS